MFTLLAFSPGILTSCPSPECVLNVFILQVRAVSARALGALVKELGEDNCSDLLPWLMETLISESSSVDRSGAAQGKSLL